jgi:hypothetical protein
MSTGVQMGKVGINAADCILLCGKKRVGQEKKGI